MLILYQCTPDIPGTVGIPRIRIHVTVVKPGEYEKRCTGISMEFHEFRDYKSVVLGHHINYKKYTHFFYVLLLKQGQSGLLYQVYLVYITILRLMF